MSGTVVSLDATTGQTLNASQTSPTLLRIADLDTMTVAAQVAEADVVKLKPGMAVYFTTLGMPEQRWQSAVRQILPTPELVNDVVLYNVLIDVANTDRLLMTDMTAQVFFIQGQASQVPLVPVAALHAGPNSGADGSYRVRVAGGDKAEGRTVQIGLMNRTSAEVVSGLKAGDEVITGMDNPAGRGDAGGQREGSGSRRQGGGGMRMRL
jgi:macrolide-specific efflux system membrane fusion protein